MIFISDFLDDGDCFRPLQYIADFGHELLFIQLWGEEDRVPTGQGEMELSDAESGAQLKIALDEARASPIQRPLTNTPPICASWPCAMAAAMPASQHPFR